ncbi:MAG: iron-containing alcohol dehydrogenase [Candidatus Omnitrophica bacterium]|nr:iron-containing alcohol dehydrogenase [Candidatus Omnitrophota bacterium]
MQNFDLYNPTNVVFGKGEVPRIGELTASYGRRVLLVYGLGSVKKTGLYDKVTGSLREAGVEWVDSGGVKPNPVLSFAREAIGTFKQEKLDAIVAVGGGSVIDTAKTVAAGSRYDGDVWDFFTGKAGIEDASPVTVVLTLAAAASEMNGGAVITNEDTLQKTHIVSRHLFPKASILDPVNTFTVPRNYSMYGAVDAIIHVLEPYFNSSDPDTPLQDRFIEGLIKTIMESADIIYRQPNNYNARANMMWGATMALNGIASSGAGCTGFPMHMIEHSLSAIYDIAHGAGLAVVAPAWMKYNAPEEPRKYAQFAERVFDIGGGTPEERALEGIAALERWFSSVDAPVTLEDAGIPAEDINKIAKNANSLSELWGLPDYTVDVIADILRLAV